MTKHKKYLLNVLIVLTQVAVFHGTCNPDMRTGLDAVCEAENAVAARVFSWK